MYKTECKKHASREAPIIIDDNEIEEEREVNDDKTKHYADNLNALEIKLIWLISMIDEQLSKGSNVQNRKNNQLQNKKG